MAERDPRKMALQIAGVRAGETQLPENERVFEDPYALYFFPEEVREQFKGAASVKRERAKYEQFMPGMNGAIVARIRYIDECLAKSLQEGLRQLVIIGAGYDTRAYRIKGVREALKVFEVDHPETQVFKKATIQTLFGNLPEHVSYVPVVFGPDRLDQTLSGQGYDLELKTLFIVEGLLMYIPPPAVDLLLSFITHGSGPGSALVGDYFDISVIEGTSPRQEAQVLRKFVEAEGAPLQFGIREQEVEDFFIDRGFSNVICTSAASCKEKYFKGASRDRTVSPILNFVHATVADRQHGV
jgi:methyltransferase (TIGR00027 family)